MTGRSIFDDIKANAALDSLAVVGSECVSYGTLISDAEAFSSVLSGLTQSVTESLVCCLPHGRAFITALLGARFGNIIFIPVSTRVPVAERNRIIEETRSSFVLLLENAPAPDGYVPAGQPMCGHRLWHAKRGHKDFLPGDGVVIYSSGSTGSPKGIVLTDDALSANVTAVASYLSLGPADRIVSFTPPHFAYAINQLLSHLWAGGAICPWHQGIFNPTGLLEQMAAIEATGLQANPSLFAALITARMNGPPLAHIRYVMSGGQPLSSSLAIQLRRLCPNARIVNMYGCTENAPRISYFWLPAAIPHSNLEWPVGKTVAGTELRIFDEQGLETPAGTPGEIGIRGTSLFRTYLDASRLKEDRMKDGWFMTRDLGYLDPRGDLVLTGRADNIILVGHEKVSTEEIESLLLTVEGVQDAAVGPLLDASLYQLPVALLVTSASLKDLEPNALRCLANSLSRAKVPRRFIKVPAIPRTAYGKIDRPAVKRLIEDRFQRTQFG